MLLLIIALVAILLYEVPSLVRKKMWRELGVFSGLYLIGAVYSVGQVMRIDLPNPADLLTFIYGPLADYLDKILQPPS